MCKDFKASCSVYRPITALIWMLCIHAASWNSMLLSAKEHPVLRFERKLVPDFSFIRMYFGTPWHKSHLQKPECNNKECRLPDTIIVQFLIIMRRLFRNSIQWIVSSSATSTSPIIKATIRTYRTVLKCIIVTFYNSTLVLFSGFIGWAVNKMNRWFCILYLIDNDIFPSDTICTETFSVFFEPLSFCNFLLVPFLY